MSRPGFYLTADWPVAAGSSCQCLSLLMEEHSLNAGFSALKHLDQCGNGYSGHNNVKRHMDVSQKNKGGGNVKDELTHHLHRHV